MSNIDRDRLARRIAAAVYAELFGFTPRTCEKHLENRDPGDLWRAVGDALLSALNNGLRDACARYPDKNGFAMVHLARFDDSPPVPWVRAVKEPDA